MKKYFRLRTFLILIIGCLLISNTILFVRSRSYSIKNENLSVENDSIISANIELKDSVQKLSMLSELLKKPKKLKQAKMVVSKKS
jgi:hypothetical protein